jgi:23S rRNA G2445 N2-methylase RlmL
VGGTELTFFATCPRGLGHYLASEVMAPEVGGEVTEVHASGVEFTASSIDVGYAACLWLRTAMRVLHLLSRSDDIRAAGDDPDMYDSLYNFVQDSADWTTLLSGGRRSFSVQVREQEPAPLRSQRQPFDSWRHGGPGKVLPGRIADEPSADLIGLHRSQICTKNAICDALRDDGQDAPLKPESHATADVPLFLALHRGKASLYRDMAGASLHKRGYRYDTPMHRSSLNEAAAAGLLYIAGFRPDGSLTPRAQPENAPPDSKAGDPEGITIVDPMCGSGTLLTEAVLCRLHIAPGLYRREFAFQKWHDFNRAAFKAIVEKALKVQRPDSQLCMRLYGSDISEAAIELARRNLSRLRMTDLVHLEVSDIADLRFARAANGMLVVCNPPWGRRLDGEVEAWELLGRFLRQHARGGRAVLLSGDASLSQGLRMRVGSKVPIRIGNVDCRALVYEVHNGRRASSGGEEHLSRNAVPRSAAAKELEAW